MNADVSQDCTGLSARPSVSAGITPPAGPILQIENLCVEYGNRGSRAPGKRAVDGLNLSVNQGEVFGFLGPNRAGFLFLASHAVFGEIFKHDKALVLISFGIGFGTIGALTLLLRLH
jgi:ABC-type antimicrobial peptide transport system ATPase subunit